MTVRGAPTAAAARPRRRAAAGGTCRQMPRQGPALTQARPMAPPPPQDVGAAARQTAVPRRGSALPALAGGGQVGTARSSSPEKRRRGAVPPGRHPPPAAPEEVAGDSGGRGRAATTLSAAAAAADRHHAALVAPRSAAADLAAAQAAALNLVGAWSTKTVLIGAGDLRDSRMRTHPPIGCSWHALTHFLRSASVDLPVSDPDTAPPLSPSLLVQCVGASPFVLILLCCRMSRPRGGHEPASPLPPTTLPPLPFDVRVSPPFVRRSPSPAPPGAPSLVLALQVSVLSRPGDGAPSTSDRRHGSRLGTRASSARVASTTQAGARSLLYVAQVSETPSVMGPMQTLISVVVARTGEEVSIDLRPGVTALLEHAERQSAAAEAVDAVGILGRPAAPATLTGEARLLLRFAPCTSVGAADAVADVEHTIYSSGKWVCVGGGGGTPVIREALGVWKVRTSWLGSVSPLDTLSTYAIFLECQRNVALVARAVAAANEATADAEMLLAAALRDDRGRPSTSAAPSEDRAARLLFCLPPGGGGAVLEHPTGTSEAAAADDIVASTGAAEAEVRTVMTPFDIEYIAHRPGGGSNSVFKHTRQDARCPLSHRNERTVAALLQHFGTLRVLPCRFVCAGKSTRTREWLSPRVGPLHSRHSVVGGSHAIGWLPRVVRPWHGVCCSVGRTCFRHQSLRRARFCAATGRAWCRSLAGPAPGN